MKLRQEVMQARRRAQSAFINTALAPVEVMSDAYQAPIPGMVPYYYGSYTSAFMG